MGSFSSHGTSFVVSMLSHGNNNDEEEATVEDAEDKVVAKPAVVDGVTSQREVSRPAGPGGGCLNPG